MPPMLNKCCHVVWHSKDTVKGLLLFIVCVLDVVCRAFYKQSMVQSDVLYFNLFHKMKLNLLYNCSHLWFIYKIK